MEHELKILPMYFDAVKNGVKEFELRKNDRDFKVDDRILLQEWENKKGYTGRFITVRVTYVLRGPFPGLEEEFCILGIKRGL